MRYIIVLFLSVLALSAYPRKIRQQSMKIKREGVQTYTHSDTIRKKDYSLIIEYFDSIPGNWKLRGPSRVVQFDFDPRLMPVFFNPSSPKFFHTYPDCKKIGAFRKLSETPIEVFLHSNKTANICPDCMQRHKTFFFISQFILDD